MYPARTMATGQRGQLVVRRVDLQVSFEAEEHVLARETRAARDVVHERARRARDLPGGVHEATKRRDHGASISSIAIEQPRGGAPGARPRSSKPPETRRTRSAASTANALSTFARSSMRAIPIAPPATGVSVSGSTGTTRAHGGSA